MAGNKARSEGTPAPRKNGLIITKGDFWGIRQNMAGELGYEYQYGGDKVFLPTPNTDTFPHPSADDAYITRHYSPPYPSYPVNFDPYFDYELHSVTVPDNDTIQFSIGGTHTAPVDYSYKNNLYNIKTQKTSTICPYRFLTRMYMSFDVSVMRSLDPSEVCQHGGRELKSGSSSYRPYRNRMYGEGAPTLTWEFCRSELFYRDMAKGLGAGGATEERRCAFSFDSEDAQQGLMGFYCGRTDFVEGQGTDEMWRGMYPVTDSSSILWEVNVTYDQSDDETPAKAKFIETLKVDGIVVYTLDWSVGARDYFGNFSDSNYYREESGYVYNNKIAEPQQAGLLWDGTTGFTAGQPHKYQMRGAVPFPDAVPNTLADAWMPDNGDNQTIAPNNNFKGNDADYDYGSQLRDTSDNSRVQLCERLPPIDWFMMGISAYINWVGTYNTVVYYEESDGTTGYTTLPYYAAYYQNDPWITPVPDGNGLGALEFEVQNIKYGMDGVDELPNGRWLGRPSLNGEPDFLFRSGVGTDQDVRYAAFNPAILAYSSEEPYSTNSFNYDAFDEENSVEGFYAFGIESGGLPDGFFLSSGGIIRTYSAEYDLPANASGLVGFYVEGASGVRVYSDVYTWASTADLFIYWDSELHSSIPTGERPEVPSADAIWVVGDPQMTMYAHPSGGTPPYDLTTPYIQYTGTLEHQTRRLEYDDSTGNVTLPAAHNSTALDFVSSRGALRLRDCKVYDSAVPVEDVYDHRADYRVQVMYPEGRAEWFTSGALPYVSGMYGISDQYYTPDPAYDMTFYNDIVSPFGYYGIDIGGQVAEHNRGKITVDSGTLPSGLLTGAPAWSYLFEDYTGYGDDWPVQWGYHKEPHGTTGSFVMKYTVDGSTAVLSREFTYICKTDGEWCTFDYGDFVQNGATPDPLYNHVWKDGAAILEVIPESLSDRGHSKRFRVVAGTLPEGVQLDEPTGQLTMNGSLSGGDDTGSYTIQLMDYGQGVREMTYTWKREGLPPI